MILEFISWQLRIVDGWIVDGRIFFEFVLPLCGDGA